MFIRGSLGLRELCALCVLCGSLLAPAASAQTGTVNGFVRDASNGEPLAYANVYLDKTELGAATNEKGYFIIGSVPAGDHELVASFVGYQTTRRRLAVRPGSNQMQVLELTPGAVELREVKVTAERARFEREVELSATRLETRQLVLAPKVGGEVDLLRTIQSLPGVIATSDFSNRLYIRGGSPDQNLILLDGITVYNPSHLFGMFSPFISEAVSDVTLLAGGFPAKYGSRLSSVLDVTTREGNSKRYTGDVSASVLAAKGLVEGPLPFRVRDSTAGDESATRAAGSFLLAGRRTYLPDLVLGALGVDGLGYYFYDVMGRANYRPCCDQLLTVAGIAAEDVLSFWDPANRSSLDARLSWGNRGLSGRWNRVFNPLLYGEVAAAWSNFRSGFTVGVAGDTVRFRTDMTDWTVKTDFTWYPADRHTLDLGADARAVVITARVEFDTTITVGDTLYPLALYADDKWEVVPGRLFAKPGLRLFGDPQHARFEVEPRLGLKYLAGKNTSVNAAAGRFSQPMVTLNSTDAVFSIYDIWLSVPDRFKLPTAWHYVAGVEHWLKPDLIVKAEGYYKDFNNLLETRYGDFFTIPDSLLIADGYSYGTELMLRKTEGRVNGWLSYSYMWTRRSAGTEGYHPHYDRRHSVNLIVNFPKVYWDTDVSAKWTLGTGLPYAGTAGYYHRYQYRPNDPHWYEHPEWEYLEAARDAFRYPAYHRLDLSLTRSWRFRWGELSAFLDVTNVYNAKNVLLYYWEPGPDGRPVRKSVGMIPILPTLGVNLKF